MAKHKNQPLTLKRFQKGQYFFVDVFATLSENNIAVDQNGMQQLAQFVNRGKRKAGAVDPIQLTPHRFGQPAPKRQSLAFIRLASKQSRFQHAVDELTRQLVSEAGVRHQLSGADIENFLRKLCPIWPFC